MIKHGATYGPSRPSMRLCLLLISLGLLTPATTRGQCVQCDRDKAVMPGHGPASALPGHDANDNRRVINVVVNNLGAANDPTSWYDSNTGSANQAIVSAIQTAANRWNNATDQYGNKTG